MREAERARKRREGGVRWKDTKEIKTYTGVSREIICTHPIFFQLVAPTVSVITLLGPSAVAVTQGHTHTHTHTHTHSSLHICTHKHTYSVKQGHTHTHTH